MTDLKTANEQLAHALKALESPEHDTDVREAEACRNRLMELDERIGARIKAKLEAHKAIALAWKEELLAPGQKPISAPPADDLQTATSVLDRLYASARADELKLAAKIYGASSGTLTAGFGVTPEPELTADAWTAHHEEHTGKYALSGEEIPDPVLVNGVAEMQQVAQADEQ